MMIENRSMRLMMFLQGAGGAEVEAIDRFFAEQAALRVIESERLADEGVIVRTRPRRVEKSTSEMRAMWVVDAASREAAVEIARAAPGGEGVIEVREAFTAADFGGEDIALPAMPRVAGTARFAAFVGPHAAHEAGELPTGPASEAMGPVVEKWVADAAMQGGGGLKMSRLGTRVRRQAAQRFVLDGPFAESKELVGGYTIVQAKDLEEAVAIFGSWFAVHETFIAESSRFEVRRLEER